MSKTYRFHGAFEPVRRSVLNYQPADNGDASAAVLRLYDPIDSWGEDWGVSAKEFTAALDAISAPEIRLHINSPGGEVFEAIAIMNALRRHPARVVAVVDGIAASCASFIAAAADETIMAPQSQLMIHDAWGACIGNAGDMRTLADVLDFQSDNIAAVYAAKTGGTVEEWRATMLGETWLSAQAAVESGLADSLEEMPAAQNAFDLSVYAGAKVPAEPAAPIEPPIEAEGAAALRAARHRLNARKGHRAA